MAAAALDELVLHGWDLAVSTGQPFTLDRALGLAGRDPGWRPPS